MVTCPVVRQAGQLCLKIVRLSVRNGAPISATAVCNTETGVTRVGAHTFVFSKDGHGENHVLGHLPGRFRIVCHHTGNRAGDSVFSGDVR